MILPPPLTESEIAHEESETAYFALRMMDVCPNCGLRLGTQEHCQHCGSLKSPERGVMPPFRWADRIDLPPNTEGHDTRPRGAMEAQPVCTGTVAGSTPAVGSKKPECHPDEAIVDRIVKANTPKAATKRVLTKKKTATESGGLF